MNKSGIIMLLIGVFLLAVVVGAKMEYYQQHYRRKNIVIKHLETTNRTVKYQNISVTADMTFFWVDTHSERDDFNDERVCMGTKLYLALMESVKHFENKDIPISPSNHLLFYTYLARYFNETRGPFNEGRDWVSLAIKSIGYPTEDKQYIQFDFDYGSGNIVNPYYKGNYYFEKKIFPEVKKN